MYKIHYKYIFKKSDNPFGVAVFCEVYHKKSLSINLLNAIGNFRNPQVPGVFRIK